MNVPEKYLPIVRRTILALDPETAEGESAVRYCHVVINELMQE